MSDPRVDFIRRLAKRPNSPALFRTLEKSRPEDIAEAMSHMAPGAQRALWSAIVQDEEKGSEVLACINEAEIRDLVKVLEFPQLLRLLQQMEVDDEADVIAALPYELQQKILNAYQDQQRTQVEDLLAYPDDSAGGLMHPNAMRLTENHSCRDAITLLQDSENVEMVFYLYVQNDNNQLVGVVSLRALLTHPPSTKLREFMITDLITVTPETHQDEVAKQVSRYDLLALPVVGHDRSLLGIITVDDVVDVIQDMATKNMMLMAGMEESSPHERSVLKSFQQRLTWLLITLMGGIGMAELIGAFEEGMKTQAIAMAGFIPVMLGTGGNVGTQAATIAVRNLATGHMGHGINTVSMMFREARVGALLGFAFALFLGGYAYLAHGPDLAIAVSIAIVATVITAALLGMLVPLTLDRLGIDPAVATGPFVTTGIDLVAILIYFSACGVFVN